jgi:predicted nucleic acid-binding protein
VIFVDTSFRVAQANTRDRHHAQALALLVDATSFALAKALRIREVLAFGGDFSAAGFTELRSAPPRLSRRLIRPGRRASAWGPGGGG